MKQGNWAKYRIPLLTFAALMVVVWSLKQAQMLGYKKAAELKNSPTIPLNDGKPWVTDASTIQGIDAMLLTLRNTELSNNGENDVLRPQLEEHMRNIFSQCTMEGKGHDYLHEYLFFARALIKDVDHEDMGTRLTRRNQLRDYLKECHKYFVYEHL